MIIRKMQADDLPQVAAIEQSLFGDPWSESAFRDTLNQKEADFIVAEDENGEMIGYCGTYRALDEAEIVNVAIRKEQQNHGYGTEMVQALIEEEKKKGAAFFFLEVRESNLSAQCCYKKLGFKTIGIRKDFYESPKENALVMQMESIAGAI